MSTGNTQATQAALEKAKRDLDGWIGTLVRAARRVCSTSDMTELVGQVVNLQRVLDSHDQCAKAVILLEHSLELEQILAAEQPGIEPSKAKPRRHRRG